MDPYKRRSEGTTNERHVQAIKNHCDSSTMDLPPSYSEAIRSLPRVNAEFNPQPSAPRLVDVDNATPCSTDSYTSGQCPQPICNNDAQNDKRKLNWDDNATRILVNQYLQMNEQFRNAKSASERDELWNIILNQILYHGYDITIFDLLKLWELQIRMYRSIIDSISSGGNPNVDWPYFEAMHNVFKDHSSSAFVDISPSSSATVLPSYTATATVAANKSSNAITTSVDVASNESMPLLTHKEELTGISSIAANSPVHSTKINNLTQGAGDNVNDVLPITNASNNIASETDLDLTKVVNTPYKGSSMFSDDTVVTSQPTATILPITEQIPSGNSTGIHHDDCLNSHCCFWPVHYPIFHNTDYDHRGCCCDCYNDGETGDNCCDGCCEGGCCNDVDCADGCCNDVDGCGDDCGDCSC